MAKSSESHAPLLRFVGGPSSSLSSLLLLCLCKGSLISHVTWCGLYFLVVQEIRGPDLSRVCVFNKNNSPQYLLLDWMFSRSHTYLTAFILSNILHPNAKRILVWKCYSLQGSNNVVQALRSLIQPCPVLHVTWDCFSLSDFISGQT